MLTAIETTGRLEHLAVRLIEKSRPRRRRSMLQFAEEEIVIPTGQYKKMPFRGDRQPAGGLLLEEIDSGRWTTIIVTAPNQTFKSLCGFVIPTLHTVLELHEDTGFACPEADLHGKKWEKDFLPVIKASPNLRRYIPEHGPGSKGGQPRDAIHFPNGASMMLFSRGGQDSNKAAVTVRTLQVTEAAGWAVVSAKSREGGPLKQLRRRMLGFRRHQRRMIIEGTTTIASDPPWSLRGKPTLKKPRSTNSRLAVPCPHCGGWISPEREHLVGWQGAETEDEAANEAFWCCPECGQQITEEERVAANKDVRLLHFGETVGDDGATIGTGPRTRTLWFRATQFNNLMRDVGDVAVEEWEAENEEDPQEREKLEIELCQAHHALPYKPPDFDLQVLEADDISSRNVQLKRREVPPGAKHISRGIDCGEKRLHPVTFAWSHRSRTYRDDQERERLESVWSGRAFELGIIPVKREQRGVRQALFDALCHVRDTESLNRYRDPAGREYIVNFTLIDAGHLEDVVWAFIADCVERGIKGYMPALGRGQSAPPGTGAYNHPTSLSDKVLWIGEQMHIRKSSTHGMPFLMFNSDEWKSFVHDGFLTPDDQNGALSHFESSTDEDERILTTYRTQLLGKKRAWKDVAKRGRVQVWEDEGREDHFLDASAMGCAAGGILGVRVATEHPIIVPATDNELETQPVTMPNGQAFFTQQ